MSNEIKAKNLKPGDTVRDQSIGIGPKIVKVLLVKVLFTDDSIVNYDPEEYLQINE